MSMTALEAWDLVRFSEQYLERLTVATAELEKKRGLKLEKGWLASALQHLESARTIDPSVLERARMLPDLEEIRGELAGQLQSQWAESVERLLAGFTFHVGSRDPVVEALFPTQKLAPLHRANREVATAFFNDFERRLKSGYVSRMLAQENFAFAGPVIEQVRNNWSRWQTTLSGGETLPVEEAAELRSALLEAGKRIDVALRQSKLLAEAALLPIAGLFEDLGLNAKPRRRVAKSIASIEDVVARHTSSAPAKASKKPGQPNEAKPEAVEAEPSPTDAEPAPAESTEAEATATAETPVAEEAPAPKKKRSRKAPADDTAA